MFSILKTLMRFFVGCYVTDRRHWRGKRARHLSVECLAARVVLDATPLVGVFDDGKFSFGDQAPEISFGWLTDRGVIGDWNGDGRPTPGVFRDGTWILDVMGNGYDSGDWVLSFGWASDIPIVGDWDGTGRDRVGVFRNGAWYRDLDGDGYTPGRDDAPVYFGWATDVPVPADWNGDGKDTPGIFRQGTWVLDETGNGYTNDDRILNFGAANAQPIAADWTGNGIDKPGVLQSNGWVFDLEGDGYTGEIAHPNTIGIGKALARNKTLATTGITRGVETFPSGGGFAGTQFRSFDFDAGQVSYIDVAGQNLLTGNGTYLIASKDGHDITETNYFSAGSTSGKMISDVDSNGPQFRLDFWDKGDNKLGFRATVTVNDDFKTVSMPFDFAKDFHSFRFNGHQYWENDQKVNTNGGTYASVEQPHVGIDAGGNQFRVGVVSTRQPTTWGEVESDRAIVRVNIASHQHYRSLIFYHHSYTNNMELHFGSMRRGETATVEGEMAVSPKSTAVRQWTFESEQHHFHQIGRADGDGWSVSVLDTPNRYLSYGPYTRDIEEGTRTAKFRLMLDNVTADNLRILTIDVYDADTGRIIAIKPIHRREFGSPFVYQEFELHFEAIAGHRLEFRTFWHGSSYARQDLVTVL